LSWRLRESQEKNKGKFELKGEVKFQLSHLRMFFVASQQKVCKNCTENPHN